MVAVNAPRIATKLGSPMSSGSYTMPLYRLSNRPGRAPVALQQLLAEP